MSIDWKNWPPKEIERVLNESRKERGRPPVKISGPKSIDDEELPKTDAAKPA
jgi:hypothetical protein